MHESERRARSKHDAADGEESSVASFFQNLPCFTREGDITGGGGAEGEESDGERAEREQREEAIAKMRQLDRILAEKTKHLRQMREMGKREVLNPKPPTPNLKAQTPKPKPETRNPKPYT
jgi:hypothetical protein